MVFAGLFSALVKQEAAAPSRTAVVVTAQGNAQVDTSISKFGNGSLLLDGAGDYLLMDATYNSYFSLNDFTFECWAYSHAFSSIDSLFNNWSNAFWVVFFSQISLRVYINGTGIINLNPNVSLNTWHHYAVQRSGSDVTLYVDGTSIATATRSGALNMQDATAIGANVNDLGTPAHFWDGNIEEVRISDIARYSSNFTPATTPFTNDSNTLLLLHCDGTNGSTSFPDDNT